MTEKEKKNIPYCAYEEDPVTLKFALEQMNQKLMQYTFFMYSSLQQYLLPAEE